MTIVDDLNGRNFVTTGNPHGLSSVATTFRYYVDGTSISGEYCGGDIIVGRIVGKATGPTTIALLFQCVTTDGELLSGQSTGRVSRNANNLMTLNFEWSWLTGDRSGGTSSYIEIS